MMQQRITQRFNLHNKPLELIKEKAKEQCKLSPAAMEVCHIIWAQKSQQPDTKTLKEVKVFSIS
jgi:hypothetical protein